MSKLSNDSAARSKGTGQQETYQTPLTDKPAELCPLNETQEWLERIMKNMKRMSMDEEYRKEIAKNLS